MSFALPWLLLLVFLLPLLAWARRRLGTPPAFLYSSARLMRPLLMLGGRQPGRWLAMLRGLALVCGVVALAQPRLTHSETRVTASGVDIVVAFDMSGSMAAEDFVVQGQRINRMEMSRRVLRQFIQRRPNDRIGLVVFATDAYAAVPPTLDHEYLLQVLDRLELGTIAADRTAIGMGLASALNRLQDLPSKSRIVILMTDGQNNAGKIDPRTAAEAAQALGVKVYTIGVGTRGRAPTPVQDVFGRKLYRWVDVDIDEATLQFIADHTGGRYFRADNAERFEEIYREIDRLEKTEAEVKKYARHRELSGWWIAAVLVLLATEVVLGETVWRRLP
ncbi:VWA domain-containing protein [Limisphaera sp. VF-2]|jgi:Ca-activated chloride channel family protein|uniref:VWA domain-containing protein n=1 Tax=Limisphaera sp. VF-2 TaxID=3400418 RepID=UPI0017624FE8|nr:VWA domain-containing protein [Limisphaera sp.]